MRVLEKEKKEIDLPGLIEEVCGYKKYSDGSVDYKRHHLIPLGPAPETTDLSVWELQLELDQREIRKMNPRLTLEQLRSRITI